MRTRRIARFKPYRSRRQGPSISQRILNWGGVAFLVLSGAALAYGLFWAPRQFAINRMLEVIQAYADQHLPEMARVEQHWMDVPVLQEFERGDEPVVLDYLQKQPLVEAVLDRWGNRTLWIREGGRLVKAPDNATAQMYRAWIAQAETYPRAQWTPSSSQDPDHTRIPSSVVRGDQYMVIKRWRPGTPQVTEALREVFGSEAPLRVGIRRASDADRRNLPKQPWGSDPSLQVDPARINETLVTILTGSDYLGEGWDLVGVPFAAESAKFKAQYARMRRSAWAVGFAIALFVALGFWLRHRSQKRALLDADRMASMTHSLKTPLAILKFRCDTLRLGRLTQDQADEELLKLGSEVDNLTQMIENGLRVIRGSNDMLPVVEVDPDWLRDVVEDLQPAFEAEGRRLELSLDETRGRAPLPSLRSALFTLLENALFHGRGTVLLESAPLRNRLQLRVTDQGEGLESHQLKAIGKPFLRLRQQGKEGFQREGQGLGLSLLCQVAEKEGWGLSFASAPGMGFQATLEIPIA